MGSWILILFLVVQKSEFFKLLIENHNYQFLKPLEWSQKSKIRTVISIFKFFDALQKYQNFLQNLFDLPFDSFLQFPCMGQFRFNLTSPWELATHIPMIHLRNTNINYLFLWPTLINNISCILVRYIKITITIHFHFRFRSIPYLLKFHRQVHPVE